MAASRRLATPDEARDANWTPEERDAWERSTNHSSSRKEAWMGWGPAQPSLRRRHVAGWDWDNYLLAYTANAPGRFACDCGQQLDMPGYHNCKCGKIWNCTVIGTGGENHQASADRYLVREIPQRPDVIVANRSLTSLTEDLTNVWNNLFTAAGDQEADPEDFPSDHLPKTPTAPATPDDWAFRNDKNDYAPHALKRRKRRQPA